MKDGEQISCLKSSINDIVYTVNRGIHIFRAQSAFSKADLIRQEISGMKEMLNNEIKKANAQIVEINHSNSRTAKMFETDQLFVEENTLFKDRIRAFLSTVNEFYSQKQRNYKSKTKTLATWRNVF